ncbi:WSC domain-containing protein 2-like [Haliotis rufescens]|uniref:WSC domain-containing protein 2-like n=1 Tax=Haliotis rufescens TaxID=6454 RepID=UPI00201E96E9|nr:WSC domain-containing protein 2-like [Haliotis rufescens]
MSCCKTLSSCGFFFSKAGRCQCLKEYGGYEIWTANLKRISASYIGCYHDDFDRVLPHGIMQNVTDLTTETCMQHCHSINYIYFGTECTSQCFCGHVIKPGHAKVPDKECNMPCAGDSSLLCGGYFRTSIYKINI